MKESEISLFRDIPLYNKVIESRNNFHTDMNSLPLFSKEMIARNFPLGFMNKNMEKAISDGQIEYATTSGTSGLQINIIRNKNWWVAEYQRAYNKNRKLAGITEKNPRIAFLTTAVCSSGVCYISNPSYQERINGNFLSLNSTVDPNTWTKKDIRRIHHELLDYNPGVLQVDPFYLLIFLRKWETNFPNEDLFQPLAIVFSYEYLSRGCKKFISEHYACDLFTAFGSTELGFLFIENENHEMVRATHHEIIEFLPTNDHIREIVVTSWKNKYMPFMRYSTCDLIEVAQEKLSANGRVNTDNLGNIIFHGRKKDLFYGTEKRPISIAMIDDAIFHAMPNLLMYRIKITLSNTFIIEGVISGNTEKAILDVSLQEALSELDAMFSNVIFMQVPSISPSISGKFSLISH
ncbi:hypothetical protein PCO82_20850 [Pectobacteriaceae bacterium CE90]|nr:hypothetical protein [Prodigiosinella sp. LS101]WJV54122.1 hypothetical protein PCO85_01105 [Prodigiosinella sp. LS101]WJV58485.1 hypothetical protein PCO84_01110 [Pectobacteriaceae bacterium C111]WJY14866.1 hypothetical protein PCO82_20850 [Pectobacteriaceae bacterium CE90]